MARPPPNRSFSYDNDDETSLDPNQRQDAYVSYNSHYNRTTTQPTLNRITTQDLGRFTSARTPSTITPGMDNLGATAPGGGISGIALGVAHTNERDSSVGASRAIHSDSPSRYSDPFAERDYNTIGTDTPYVPEPPTRGNPEFHQNNSYSSQTPLGVGAASVGRPTPPGSYQSNGDMNMDDYTPQRPGHGGHALYTDSPYQRYSSAWDPRVGQGDFRPEDIEDDGDDGMTALPTKRRSMLNLSRQSDHNLPAGAAASGVAAGGALGALGGIIRKPMSTTPSGNYGPVPGYGTDESQAEKSEWLASQTSSRKKWRWIVGIAIAVFLIGAIAGGVIGGIKSARNSNSSSGSSSNGSTASQDDGKGDLTKDSAEIKAMMNNPNLHKVFPGMDYSPFKTQYPDCLLDPPSQNNVTRDMAMLSQLTNVVRLYGTDCNQTEMVLHSIDKLGLTDMKVWLSVWLDKNSTTRARGLTAMYDLIDKYGTKPFLGVVLGNEVLYAEYLTVTELSDIATGVRSNFTSKNINLPIAVADLGDNWTKNPDLTKVVDVIMSNIHPFFAGQLAEEGAGWTWDFWQRDIALTQGTNKQNIISEVGWPSAGGKNCGAAPTCDSNTPGSIAGIDQMNTFMDSWVCQSLANSTNYFWFEAFDEPWKIHFDLPGKEWEDKWGLMDINRNLKPGVKIPDCGKTV